MRTRATPSGLPAISPSRGEISCCYAFANHRRCRKRDSVE
ncbi:MAG: propionyl-coenzyme A carboxylase alpha polypeptide, partial [Mesorhizobium sp.]